MAATSRKSQTYMQAAPCQLSTESGIVTKNDGRYTLTTFGRIAYNAQKKVNEAVVNF